MVINEDDEIEQGLMSHRTHYGSYRDGSCIL